MVSQLSEEFIKLCGPKIKTQFEKTRKQSLSIAATSQTGAVNVLLPSIHTPIDTNIINDSSNIKNVTNIISNVTLGTIYKRSYHCLENHPMNDSVTFDHLDLLNNIFKYYDHLVLLSLDIDEELEITESKITNLTKLSTDMANILNEFDDLHTDHKKRMYDELSILLTEIGTKPQALHIAKFCVDQELHEFEKLLKTHGYMYYKNGQGEIGICKICYDNTVNRVIDGCMHAFCESCINQLLGEVSPKCPLCKFEFISSTRFYI